MILLYILGYIVIGFIVIRAIFFFDDCKDTSSWFECVLFWPLTIIIYLIFVILNLKIRQYLRWLATGVWNEK